jgi:hypothetical protein
VFSAHPQNGLNGLILNSCTGGCWFTPAIELKRWTIILTIGQHCHFLIFGFEMDAQENGEEDPCMKILLKEIEKLGDDCAILKEMQTTIRIWATPFPYKIRGI